MAWPADRHLTPEELEALVSGARQDWPSQASLADAGDVSAHLAQCPQCRALAAVLAEIQIKLTNLRSKHIVPPLDNCPSDSVWPDVLARLIPEASAIEFIAHAASCDQCGVLLRQAVESFNDQVTSDEELLLSKLESGNARWQADLAKRLTLPTPSQEMPAAPTAAWQFHFSWKVFAFASAAIVILAAFSWVAISNRGPRSASRLLSASYTEHRTIEMRFYGAGCAPVRIERGAARSDVDKPQALLTAEALISRRLKRAPNDPQWLEARGRADLLDGKFDSAVESFEQAREIAGDSAELLSDLASAHFERAKATGRAVDYGAAVDLLGEAIALSPDDPVLLFNRALANEQMLLYDEAIRDWEKFLTLERDSGWAAEGRSRLADLRSRIQKQQQSYVAPSHDPALAILAIRERQGSSGELDQFSDEDYLSVATADWLPMLASGDRQVLNASGRALTDLSSALKSHHHDKWLSEIMTKMPSPGGQAAIRHLSEAVRANKDGDPSLAISQARTAKRIFSKLGNNAGEIRSQLEYLIGLNRLQRGDQCRPVALNSLQARSQDYPWIKTNLLLEAATCFSLAGDPGRSSRFAHEALLLSARSHYAILQLRSRFYEDGVATPPEAAPEAWHRIRSGLQEYWGKPYPPMSAFEFYSDLGFAAEDMGMWHLAEAAGHESLRMVSLQDRGFEAAAHHWLAQVSEMAGDSDEAEREYQSAGQMFKLLPSPGTTEVTTEIERGSLEIDRGDFDVARGRLNQIRAKLSSVSNSYASMLYHLSLGKLGLHEGNLSAAEEELATAILVSEQGSGSLDQESDRLTWNRNSARAYRLLLELYSRSARDDFRSLAFLEWYRAAALRTNGKREPSFQGDAQGSSPTAREQISRSLQALELPHDTPVLTWAVFPTGVKIWLYDGTTLQSAWSDVPISALRNRTARFVRLCSDPASDYATIRMDARQLYQWLVRPVATGLVESRSVTLEPDGFLEKIPFSALIDENDRYLGARFKIVESPGIAYLNLLERKLAVSKDHTILAVGNPLLPSSDNVGLRSLGDAEREAREVASRFEHVYLLTGSNANFRNLLRSLNQAEVFHFAGHAISHGRGAGLLLADDVTDNQSSTLLAASDLTPERLTKLRVAVLSGCETASVENGMTDSNSLVRSFLRAGVPQVIASKWPVDSRASRAIMNHLYDSLILGNAAAYSLSQAQELARLDPETSHPYYWAAFSSFGRSN